MKTGLTTIFDDVAKVISGISMVATARVMVGIPAAKDQREDGGEINNAALGYIHDRGAPEANIPARPWLESGIATAQTPIEDGLKRAADAAFEGRPEGVRRELNVVGLKAQAAVRKKITDGPFDALAPRTLAARRARGRTGTKPLIDTGQLRSAVSYVIREKDSQ